MGLVCKARNAQRLNYLYKDGAGERYVKNAEGEPLVGAIVRIDEAFVEVDETGAFSFEAIEEGDYTMAVDSAGAIRPLSRKLSFRRDRKCS